MTRPARAPEGFYPVHRERATGDREKSCLEKRARASARATAQGRSRRARPCPCPSVRAPLRRRTARMRRAGGASWRRERAARRTARADGASWRRERTVRDGRCARTARVGGARGGGQTDGRDGE